MRVINGQWYVRNTLTGLKQPFTEIEVGAERYIWASHPLKGFTAFTSMIV
jgi:hypothetical protein